MPVKHLFKSWDKILPLIEHDYVMLCLDYDGTLTPIVEMPALAKLSPQTRNTLKELSGQKEIQVALISGRSLPDLKKMVGVPGLVYVGNHGFELESSELRHVHPGAAGAVGLLKDIEARLKKTYLSMNGVLVENKKFTLSIHFRRLSPKQTDAAKRLLDQELAQYLKKFQIVVVEGKKVWEIRPAVGWNKGKMVLWLLGRLLAGTPKSVLPIYLGDDTTDEDAFRALKGQGISIRITEDIREPTEADYVLSSAEEVLTFLEKIKDIKTKTSKGKERVCR